MTTPEGKQNPTQEQVEAGAQPDPPEQDPSRYAATAEALARHAAREGALPEGYKRPDDPALAALMETVLLMLGNALLLLDELWSPPDRSANGVVTGQLTAIALAEAYHRDDPERFVTLLPHSLAELGDVTAHLAGTVAQLVDDRWPGEQELAYEGMRAECTTTDEETTDE